MQNSKLKILIVEDSKVDLIFMTKSLENFGYELIGTVNSGEEAIEISKTRRPDLILMDIELGKGMSGIEASQVIMKNYKIPVIFTTSHSDPGTLKKVKEASPYGYLIKPIDKKNLYISIELSIERHNYITEIVKAKEENAELNLKLQKHIEELNRASEMISISEEKYRLIVEGSNDIFFSMDDEWKFITINNAIQKHLNININNIIGKKFQDLLYEGYDGTTMSKQLVIEKLDQFENERKPLMFKALFKTSIVSEPKEMQVKLEYINILGKNEILGKASSILDDSLMKYFVSEKQKFTIDNYLTLAEDISHRVTRNLAKFFDPKNLTLLRISLREIIINAIEHGNLNITFEEKTKITIEGNYIEFIGKRQNNPVNRDKHVTIEYSIDEQSVTYKVTDQGEGFNHKDYLEKDVKELKMLAHGRGLAMAKSIFDEIKFNKKGNQVLLVKHFKNE